MQLLNLGETPKHTPRKRAHPWKHMPKRRAHLRKHMPKRRAHPRKHTPRTRAHPRKHTPRRRAHLRKHTSRRRGSEGREHRAEQPAQTAGYIIHPAELPVRTVGSAARLNWRPPSTGVPVRPTPFGRSLASGLQKTENISFYKTAQQSSQKISYTKLELHVS